MPNPDFVFHNKLPKSGRIFKSIKYVTPNRPKLPLVMVLFSWVRIKLKYFYEINTNKLLFLGGTTLVYLLDKLSKINDFTLNKVEPARIDGDKMPYEKPLVEEGFQNSGKSAINRWTIGEVIWKPFQVPSRREDRALYAAKTSFLFRFSKAWITSTNNDQCYPWSSWLVCLTILFPTFWMESKKERIIFNRQATNFSYSLKTVKPW